MKAIFAYIAADSAASARAVLQDTLNQADLLDAAPRMGRMVPEAARDDVREISSHSWRVIYHLRDERIFILAVVHKRRSLSRDAVDVMLTGLADTLH